MTDLEENDETPKESFSPEPPGEGFAPKCPYCKTKPAKVLSSVFQLGPLVMMTIFCANPACNKILGVFPVGQAAPPPEERRLITVPGREN